MPTLFPVEGKATWLAALDASRQLILRSQRSQHAEQQHAREPGDLGNIFFQPGQPGQPGSSSIRAGEKPHGGYVPEELDCAALPVNQPNNEERFSAQVGEGRAQAKENIARFNTSPTQSGIRVTQGLSGVRQTARERRQERFTALLHHLSVVLLRDSFYGLKREAAPGVDGVRWKEYETGLEDRLVDLHRRVHRGVVSGSALAKSLYREDRWPATTVGRRGAGGQDCSTGRGDRSQSDYEVGFKGFSYEFRPGRNPHQALDALSVGIQTKRVNWVFDADIRRFFDHLNHEWLLKFVEHRVGDSRIFRLIEKWLKAGMSEDGRWSETRVGTPQGAVASPLTSQRTPALCIRSVGRSLVQESGSGRCDRRPVRR